MKLSKGLSDDLFFLANNLNLRHNNVGPSDAGNHKKAVADMAGEELEGWYDLCHRMCAAAFLLLHYDEHATDIKNLKISITS